MSQSVVSLFSGLGGLDRGFERAGFDVVWANDASRDAVDSYARNFRVSPVHAPIEEVDLREIPSAEVVIGGPPCQAFSLVGQRLPDDPRGALVFSFLAVVAAKRPRAFVMENVPGMTSSRINGVRLTDVLAAEFTALGYNVLVETLLATDFLVPQRRRRVVIVGTVDRQPLNPVGSDFAREVYGTTPEEFGLGASDAIGDLGDCVARGKLAQYGGTSPSAFASLMRDGAGTEVTLHECPRMSETDRELVAVIPPGGNYMDVPDELATDRILRFKATGGRTTTYGRLHPDKPAYTINTYFRRPNVGANFHYEAPRLITPREAMRFQALPDSWAVVATSQDSRNALIGNAVPSLMAEGIGWSLAHSLSGRQNALTI